MQAGRNESWRSQVGVAQNDALEAEFHRQNCAGQRAENASVCGSQIRVYPSRSSAD